VKILITGGTGLIGKVLAKNLLADGHQVIILTRNPAKSKNVPTGATLVAWDAKTASGWVEHANGADAIVNLAGANLDRRWTASYKETVKQSRVDAGKAVVEAVAAATEKPKVVIQASGIGYYGPHGDEIITEASPAGDDFLAKVCKAWEASSEAVEAYGVRRVVIRTGIVLATQGGAMARLVPIFRFFAGGPVGSAKQYYPWIHLADEVDAIRFLIENPGLSGPFNLTAPNPAKNAEFVKALGKALNRPALAPAPGFVLKLMFGEMSTVVLDGQRAIPQRLQEAGYKFRFDQPEPAMRHLLHSGYED
jgi:uncharacterized protein